MRASLLILPCLLLEACAATTPPWGSHGGHVYGNYPVYARGHCPPGLAKKGCIPPGQATKWRRGHPLARDVVFYELSPRMERRMGRPPAGYRYIRVAEDILMITVGTGIVVDAVYDLSKM